MRLPGPAIACYLAAGVFAAVLSVSFAAHAGQEHPAHSAAVSASAAAQQAKDKTQALLEQSRHWQAAASGADKTRARQQLAEQARSRALSLAELAQTNPQAVLELAISEEQRSGMPAEVQAMLEQRFEAEGTVEAYYEDYEDGSHRLRHFLTTPAGERMSLHLAGAHSDLNSGDEIQAEGVLLETEQQGLSYLAFTADGSTMTTTATAAPTQTTGDQRTLVLMVNFEDDTSQPFTEAEISNAVFGTASDFFFENSHGLMSLSGEVHGWYTLPMSASGCDSVMTNELADQAALADGIDLSAFQRIVLVQPKRSSCGWAGLSSLGGQPSRVTLNGNITDRITTHEVGHTLGLHHAHSWDCQGSVLEGECRQWEYGDSLDVMGGRLAHLNSYHKTQLNWFDGPDSVLEVQQSGVFNLEPYSTEQGPDPKALKILRSQDPVTGLRSWLYVEYRQPVGFDSIIVEDSTFDSDNILDGVIVRIGEEDDHYYGSYLLDMTPDSRVGGDHMDPALAVGRSFTDPESGITISTQWTDTNGAQVAVEMGTTTVQCSPAQPELTLSPVEGSSGAPGQSVGYRLTITNRDAAACEPVAVALDSSVPSGWTAVIEEPTLTLAPGASATTLMMVSSSADAGEGFYTVTAYGQHELSGDMAQTTSGYTVSIPITSNQPPQAMDDSAETAKKSTVTIAVLANDTDPDGDLLSITSISQPAHGQVNLQADGTLSYRPDRRFSGSDSFSYTVSDGTASASAQVAVTVGGESSGSSGSNNKGKGKG
ncbi:Ig-like domain-containing protein [Oceanimonas sp. CHS3-5]|uniref:Ig-like domain-containing protein n=1 Tax=Oceanimonas sp. CHS3-5 TaxID=3068186 RepID=UPI00273F8567|nr:Ig-like domain-containing protein [Oceanimonas sp. CHS3-5]MDP5293448.1 Ig-like domain-containing protein [Oceanimonas sp. CHS3-5]